MQNILVKRTGVQFLEYDMPIDVMLSQDRSVNMICALITIRK